MPPADSLYVALAGPGAGAFIERDAGCTVVWLRGEFDLGSVPALAEVFARAIAVDGADLVVDLSQVRFLDASTLGFLVRADAFLGRRGRALRLRQPSEKARLILDICHLTGLLGVPTAEESAVTGTSGSLKSWVAVPASERIDTELGESTTRHRARPPSETGIAAALSTVRDLGVEDANDVGRAKS
ncbi:MAG: STAS domain-containing protein [Acidimicrobiia bacterium]|nr:STAS domain-containing protein [Acidimicrobiia bacterium]